MARIKVTGYIETEDLPFSYGDSNHEIGLSNHGYEQMQGSARFATPEAELIGISDVEFELVED